MTALNAKNSVKITVLYDNYPYQAGLKTGWGFACVVSGLEKKVLFDTGGDGEILLHNMRKLEVDPKSIEVVFLSHIDGDHTDGLGPFLLGNPNVSVYLPASFPERFTTSIASAGAKVFPVSKPSEVCDRAYTTGEMDGLRPEQALVVKTSDLTAIITGCAHPGISEMVSTAKEHWGGESVFIVGGFHLFPADRDTIKGVIADLKRSGVKWAAPCHCSGDLGKHLFREEFGDHCLEIGVGRMIDLSALA